MASVSNSLTKANQKMGMAAYVTQEGVKAQINKIVGGKDGTAFITSIVSAVQNNPALQECTNQSILSAALLGQSLRLSPQLGYYYMIPFGDKNRGKVAQFQMGYKGFIQLAIRSGQYKKINAREVKEGELNFFDPFDEEISFKSDVYTDWDSRLKAETIGYYAMFELMNGFKKVVYMSKSQMESFATTYSQAYKAKKGYSFWEKDFDEMGRKTVIKQLLNRWGILSTELANAIQNDEAVVNEDGSKNYIDVEEAPEVVSEAPEPAKTEAPAEDPAAALFGGK